MKLCLILLSASLAIASAEIQRYGSRHTTVYQSPTVSPTKFSQNTHSSSNDKDMKTLRNDQEINADGSYHYAFETENGIAAEESGMGGVAVKGSTSYISPEGIAIKTTYVADETGYHAVGDHIPKIPDYVLRALEYIRTHPAKPSKEYESEPMKVFATATNVNAYTAPPTYKPAPRRGITPTPRRYKKQQAMVKDSYSRTQNNRKF